MTGYRTEPEWDTEISRMKERLDAIERRLGDGGGIKDWPLTATFPGTFASPVGFTSGKLCTHPIPGSSTSRSE